MELKKIAEISHDVWQVFVKYYASDADLKTFTQDVHKLDEKYKDTDGYELMKSLNKTYFDELNRMKG